MDRAARLRKRGSLQARERHTISKASGERLYSVPNFLELAGGDDVIHHPHQNKRTSVIIYGNRNNKKSIRAGNLDGLVELLTMDETTESMPDYVEAFIATHSYFVNSQALMTRLMERFYDEDARMISIFKKWITCYFEDFTEENEIFFNMFLSNISSKGFEAQANELRQVFKEQEAIHQKRVAKEQVDAENESKALASDDIVHRIPDLEDDAYDPAVIAKQMTLIEEKLYKEVSLREFLQLAWSKKDGQQKARRLNRLISRFNSVSFFVATAILTCDHSAKKRGKMLALFIQVGDACLELRNYQSAMQIYSALNLTPIERLEKEWKSLPKKVVQMYDRLKEMFESSGNFKKYRETLAQTTSPAIPVLSFILSDLTMIEENKDSIKLKVDAENGGPGRKSVSSIIPGMHSRRDSDVTISDPESDGGVVKPGEGEEEEESELVHFEKMSMIYQVLSNLKRCGRVPYPQDEADEKTQHDKKGGRSKEELVKMLTELPRLKEKELYDLKNDTKKKVKELRKLLKASRKK